MALPVGGQLEKYVDLFLFIRLILLFYLVNYVHLKTSERQNFLERTETIKTNPGILLYGRSLACQVFAQVCKFS